jgi:alanine dehydrogenase
VRIGILREGKNPPDSRVPFSPKQAAQLPEWFPGVEVVVQPSPTRCFTDDEYRAAGLTLQEDLSDCDVLMGVKEVPIKDLIAGKTYFFFSHTKKAQPYNQPLMRALLQQNIRMIDYETLTHPDESRVLGFGTWAGVVGAHNAFKTWGQRTGLLQLPAAYEVHDYETLKHLYDTVRLPNLRIVLTGSGRVAKGGRDVLEMLRIREVSPEVFRNERFEEPVFTHLKGADLYQRKAEGGGYDRNEFHHHPDRYESIFEPYLDKTDILINGIYWQQEIDRLFEKEDVQKPDFRIRVIADVTCDADGSVPINVGSSTIADPVYGISRKTLQQTAPFQNTDDTVDVMAVDNLPNELPRDASAYFGEQLIRLILPELLKADSELLHRATICESGKLTPQFNYLKEYAGL